MHRKHFALLPVCALCASCTFHSVASHWNGRVGPDGVPVFVRTVTSIGLNLAVVLPVAGDLSIDELVDDSTRAIAAQQSDHVRVIESSSVNYWNGFPPFTWLFTPVITSVAVEYRPSPAELAAATAAERQAAERARARQDDDHGSVIPDRQR
ncbi:MAG: hypothetical protein U1E73_08375 [Planctomycetota bacterium]